MRNIFKPLFLITVIFLLLTWGSSPALALPADVDSVLGKIIPPPQVIGLGVGAAGISRVLSNIIIIIFVVASILFVFMVVISALQWIVSGGDKEAVAKARSRLTYAIIGIVLLALSFLILRVIGQITGFSFFKGSA